LRFRNNETEYATKLNTLLPIRRIDAALRGARRADFDHSNVQSAGMRIF